MNCYCVNQHEINTQVNCYRRGAAFTASISTLHRRSTSSRYRSVTLTCVWCRPLIPWADLPQILESVFRIYATISVVFLWTNCPLLWVLSMRMPSPGLSNLQLPNTMGTVNADALSQVVESHVSCLHNVL